ncbi:hypothetical protein K435DRAFT_779405 [Dendrothele bispora CBS 962.96]|uniref:Uncharacterized protein n=1 Tax=Dendrothele bispora (strain CBS 962.96) TaxID=1314807 RepID=A0A4S8LXS6_DENBC|nr:hypothetical protein K435DRAFT_779405 [Dendrothele bispora CBS 962.96]
MLIVFIFALFSFLRIIFSVVMYFNPAFKAKVAERRAAKRARIQELEAAGKRRSRRSIGIEVVINCLFSVAWILNDAVFNRPEGTAIVDGAKARVIHNIALCAVVVPIECLVFSLFIFIAVIFKVRRARKGQIKLQGDEELMVGVPTQEMAQVPSMKEGFEEKLIEIDDSVERFEEKMSKEERTEIDN